MKTMMIDHDDHDDCNDHDEYDDNKDHIHILQEERWKRCKLKWERQQ